MIELYSIRDVSRILAVQESRLRYWMQTGFVGPTVRKGGRFYYTFPDLVAVKAAKDLLETGMTLQRVRKIERIFAFGCNWRRKLTAAAGVQLVDDEQGVERRDVAIAIHIGGGGQKHR